MGEGAPGPAGNAPPAEPAQAEAVLAWLRERTGEMAELLARLAREESPSSDPECQTGIYSILAGELSSLGFEVERVAGRKSGDHLLARRPGGDGKAGQLLLGHLDTVWPIGTLSEMPVEEREGLLFGPGVYDMKGGLVQMLFALRALSDLGLRPACPTVVFVNADEEVGSFDSRPHLERLAAGAARVFVLEPSFGPAGKLKTGRKGVGRFNVRFLGIASHAGLDPEGGASAILELSEQVQRLFALNDPDRGVTVNVGRIDGGLRPNVVAPEAVAEVEVRVVTAADAERLQREIRGLEPIGEGVSLEVEGGFGRPPLERTPRNRVLWDLARRLAGDLGLELGEALVGGASDGNLTSVHTATLDGLGAVGDGAHAQHEHVVVERMPERAALLAMLLTAAPTR